MDASESDRQEENKKFVEQHVLLCQSSLVDELLKNGIFVYDDIINLYPEWQKDHKQICRECSDFREVNEDNVCEECHMDQNEPQEIYEWWLCSDWMIEKLKEIGEPVLENDYGSWWGRTCSGQAILLDHTIDKLRSF